MSKNSDFNPEQMVKIQKSLAMMVKQKEAQIEELKSQLADKEKEIRQLKETNKIIENKNEEIFKNCTQMGTSDISEIKTQFDNEKRILSEMIKTLNNDLTGKNASINKLNEELSHCRNQIEFERKQNLKYFALKSEDKAEIQIHKISSENTSLKTSLLNYEETISSLSNTNKMLLAEKNEIEKKFEEFEKKNKILVKAIRESHENMLKEFTTLSTQYALAKKRIEEISAENISLKKEVEESQKKNLSLESKIVELTSEVESLKNRNSAYNYEVSTLKKDLKNYEKIISDYKLSKQVFNVNYNYMSLTLNGNIIIEKEGNGFSFIIENRTATRKFSFLDVDLFLDQNDPSKVTIKFNRDDVTEEYFTREAKRLVETFADFKKKVIEMTDSTSTAKTNKVAEDKVIKTQKQLDSFLGIL